MLDFLIIGGPTAVGKSELACCLAERVGGEIVSADSMAVYRGMDIGTAKPLECTDRVRHHLIDIAEPGEYFDAKLFEKEARNAVKDIKERGRLPIVCGGTYLYLQALLYGIEETPPPNWNLRRKLYRMAEKKGREHLYRKLRIIDPLYAKKIHPHDVRRSVRALEVFLETGRAFSSFHRWDKPRFNYLGIYVSRGWEELSRRIEVRVHRMIEEGLIDEVKELLDKGFECFLTSSQAIGYKELIPYLRGEVSLEEAVEEIVKNTREYAKRQIRWFRRQGWVEVNLTRMSPEEACEKLLTLLP